MITAGSEIEMVIATGTATATGIGTSPRISAIETGIEIAIETEGTNGERVNGLERYSSNGKERAPAHWSSNEKGLATGTRIQEGIHRMVTTGTAALRTVTGAMAEDPSGT